MFLLRAKCRCRASLADFDFGLCPSWTLKKGVVETAATPCSTSCAKGSEPERPTPPPSKALKIVT